ncbi:MAG: chromate resistance protein [Hyphomicrobiales bacterium]|nr:chromate resistance protein [Hyphomicrobiales bacterium]
MLASSFFISPTDLWSQIGTAQSPQIVDARRRDAFDAAGGVLPTAVWRNAIEVQQWAADLDFEHRVVVACREGHELSQMAAAELRALGFDAAVLAGGYTAWSAASLPMVTKAALDRLTPGRPSQWVTRRRPKIDRVACPWLIRRFLDRDARLLYVDPPEVPAVARESGAIPYDIEGVELSHDGPRCTFDTMLKLFGLEDEPSLARLAVIVRGADTARPDLAPEASGLLAVSLGLSALAGDDDHGMLAHGFIVYDALFAWLRHAANESHNWPAKTA